jgi:AAA family ATP:ADP antiporter
MSSTSSFGKIRSFLWPIHSYELSKFIPMLLVFFLIAFNYNILRAAKDTLVVTAPASGAEAIPFIKVWAILPMALLMTYIFTKLSNKYSTEKVFYIMIGIFLGFFAIFTFILYPLRETLQPNNFANMLQRVLPQGFNGFIAMIRNWILTCFYVMAELWGTIMLTVLFWGFANEITTVHEAKRFYSLFSVGANVAGTLSGQAAIFLSSNIFFESIPYGKNAWEQSVLFTNITILITGSLIIGLFIYINKKTAPINTEPTISQVKPPKIKISLKKSFSYLLKSKYLIFLALIVLSYNLTTHIAEIVWKNQISQVYPNPSDFNAYMGHVMRLTGIVATAIALFISGNFLRKFSWTFSALITPLIVLSTGIFFFSFFFFKAPFAISFAGFFSSTPLIMSVFFGTLQNTLSRASKYTLFDATKEIAFIPLNKESKRKGKAAIDGVGSRFGKSFGSVLTQSFLILFSTLTASAPYIAILFLFILGIWLLSIIALGKQFNALTSHNEKISIKEEAMSFTNKLSNTKDIKKYYPFILSNEKDKIKR